MKGPIPNPADDSELFFDGQASFYRDAYGQSLDFQDRWRIWTGLIDRLAASRCLDVGCGAGLFSLHVASRGIPTVGLDRSQAMIESCRAEQVRRGLTNLQFRRGSLPLSPDLALQPADLVLCSSVLEYVEPLDEAIASLAAHTLPGGHVIVSLPNRKSLYRRYEQLRHRWTGRPEYCAFVHHRLTLEEATERFAQVGLVRRELAFYGREPLLSRLAIGLRGPAAGANLFVLLLEKVEGACQ